MQQSCLLRAESDPETNKKKTHKYNIEQIIPTIKKLWQKEKKINKQNKTKNPKHSVS